LNDVVHLFSVSPVLFVDLLNAVVHNSNIARRNEQTK
jgi:hypothetical protein